MNQQRTQKPSHNPGLRGEAVQALLHHDAAGNYTRTASTAQRADPSTAACSPQTMEALPLGGGGDEAGTGAGAGALAGGGEGATLGLIMGWGLRAALGAAPGAGEGPEQPR
jgi:hypothetical protein